MSGMTWREIRQQAINACGQTSEAGAEFPALATAAVRELYAVIDVPELEKENRLTVRKGHDRVAFPADVFGIHHVFNLTTGERVEPEEEGVRGRSKFLEETTGQPPEGSVHRYVRSGANLLVRDRADEDTSLQLAYKIIPPAVTDGVLDAQPLAPAQYDWPTIWMIASVYYSLHPPSEEGQQGLAQQYQSRALTQTQQLMKNPRAYEERDKRSRLQAWGYQAYRFDR